MTVVTVTEYTCNQCGFIDRVEPGAAPGLSTWRFITILEEPREVKRSGHLCCLGCATDWLRMRART